MAPTKDSLDRLKIDRTAPPARAPLGGGALTALVVAVLLVGGGIWWFARPKPAAVRTAVAREVSSAGGARTLLNASGYVTARRLATVSSKVTGRVLDVLIEEGMKVDEGQILAHLDATNTEASLRLAEAQLASARSGLGETQAQLDLANLNLTRTRSLAAAKAASPAELDQAQADTAALAARLERLRADITVAERQVAVWKQQLDDAIIRAPYAGIIVSKNAQAGEMISPISAGGGFTRTGICTIVDMKSLEVEVDVNESYINRVAAGQPVSVTLDSYPDSKIGAKVIAIVPTADRQKATVRVRVGFDQLDPRILPDMGLKVAFQSTGEPTAAGRAIVVPQSAVRRADSRDIVWVVKDGRVERRAVTVQSTLNQEATLAAGVNAGEKVVAEGPVELTEGARVTELP
jgi:HlyD family secretion protein